MPDPVCYITDEDTDGRIVKGMEHAGVPFVRSQDVLSKSADDPEILAYAAEHNMVVISHDVHTMRDYFWDFVSKHWDHPGLILIVQDDSRKVGTIVRWLSSRQPEQLRSRETFYPDE